MAKTKKAEVKVISAADLDVQAVQVQEGDTRYVPSPKYTGREGTKYGTNGTRSTFALICDAASSNGGTLTYAQVQAVARANGDPGFAAYAVRRKYLVPHA